MQTNTNRMPALWTDSLKTTPARLSHWIDEVFEDALNWPRVSTGGFIPELNIYETDTEFEISVALPGMNKKDVEITYNGGVFTISGERKMDMNDTERKYHRIESRFGKFSRSLPLPQDVVEAENITAKYENGVLNVTVPKVKEKAAKRIDIK